MNYDFLAKGYNELHKEEQLKKLNIIKPFLKINKKTKLLDVGCGTGISTNFFKCEVIGIDSSREMIKNGKGNLILGKAEKLIFKNKSFDIVLCITAFHNFSNKEKALKEMVRVRKDSSTMVVTLLKKAKDYKKLKNLIIKYLKPIEIDSDKDTIFISRNN